MGLLERFRVRSENRQAESSGDVGSANAAHNVDVTGSTGAGSAVKIDLGLRVLY